MLDDYLNQDVLEIFHQYITKTALGKLLYGEPDVIKRDKIIYRNEAKLNPKWIEIAKKNCADGIEVHVTVPKGKPPHISVYVYWLIGGFRWGCLVAHGYITDDRRFKTFLNIVTRDKSFEKNVKEVIKRFKEMKCKLVYLDNEMFRREAEEALKEWLGEVLKRCK